MAQWIKTLNPIDFIAILGLTFGFVLCLYSRTDIGGLLISTILGFYFGKHTKNDNL